MHPNQRFLYAVNEVSRYEGRDGGSVSAFSIDRATGTLTLLNRVSSRGGGPCHLELDRSGKWLFVANYGGGSVAAFPVQDDGKLGEASAFFQHAGASANAARQSGPHAHATVVSPDNRYVLAADLGLDKVFSYKLDPAKGGLAPDPQFTAIAPGSGPRHLAFRPDGKFVYVLKEMLSAVVAFRYDAGGGTLAELQTLSTLPEGFSGETAERRSPRTRAGKFLVHLESRRRQHRDFPDRRGQGDADVRRPGVDARQDAARFRDRPVRPLPRRRESEFRHRRRLPDRSGDRRSDACGDTD